MKDGKAKKSKRGINKVIHQTNLGLPIKLV
jgi:hypothetical protein